MGCPIKRTKVTKHSTISMATGEEKTGRTTVGTEACGIPLFGDKVCRACAQGWEVPENKFASAKEKAKAKRMGK